MNKLLIVEDEKMIRQGIKAMIMRSGVEIEEILECRNGLEALDVLTSQKIDVMFTDIRMPKMDGITLVKEVQKLPNKPKVVVVSGFDEFSYAVELLRCGAKEYLLKPVEREKIQEILEKLEQEIQQEKHQKKEQIKLASKELKYFLAGEQDSAMEHIEKDAFAAVQEKDYFVICTNVKKYTDLGESIIDIGEIGGQEVFVVFGGEKDAFIRDVLGENPYGESEKHKGIGELRKGYEEAVNARKHAFFEGKKTIHKEEYEDKEFIKENINEEELAERVTQLIGTEKLEEAIKIIQLWQYKVEEGVITIDRFEHFVQCLMKQVETIYTNIIDHKSDTIKALKGIYGFESENEYFDSLIKWCQELNQVINEEFSDYKNKQKIQAAITYIQKNYNKDLNMAVVSNHVSMNYTLFSVVFKQYTGMNFVNYLKHIRFEEAKRLLATTDKKVIEISSMIGYENEKHFMKVFKSHLGVSPSEYRKNAQIGKGLA